MQVDAKAVTFSQEAATLTSPTDAANDTPATSTQTAPQTTDLAPVEHDLELGIINTIREESAAAPTLEERALSLATRRINEAVGGTHNPTKMLRKAKHLIATMESSLLTDNLTPAETEETALALQYLKSSSSQLELTLYQGKARRQRRCYRLLSCPLIFVAAPAAVGAVSGAIGFPVMMSARNWTTSGITHINFVDSMAVGGIVAIWPTLGVIACFGKYLEFPIATAVLVACNGALSGLIGAGMLGLLAPGAPDKGHQNISFAVTAGITGNLIILAPIFFVIATFLCLRNPRTRKLCPTMYDAILHRFGLSFRDKTTSSSQHVVELPPTQTAEPAAQTVEPAASLEPVAQAQTAEPVAQAEEQPESASKDQSARLAQI